MSIAGMSDDDLDARPIPNRWSTREVVCHIADFELVYSNRMKRVISENTPTFRGADPDVLAATLAYGSRNVDEELQFIAATRHQMARILHSLPTASFQRTGNHTEDGLIDLRTLLTRIKEHLPHHVTFINEKRLVL